MKILLTIWWSTHGRRGGYHPCQTSTGCRWSSEIQKSTIKSYWVLSLEQFRFEWILDWSFLHTLIVSPPILVNMLVQPLVIGLDLKINHLYMNQYFQPPPTLKFHPCHLAGKAFGNGEFSSMSLLFICIWKCLSFLCTPFIYFGTWYMGCLAGVSIFKLVVRYLLVREGVHAPGGPAFLAHTKQKVSNIVGLTALRLAFFLGYE